jgi:O-antigen/teichoic acid export membrane protein
VKAIRNAAWLTVGRLIADVLSAVLFVVISRRFGPHGLGQYSYGFAIASFTLIFSGVGATFGVREFARLPEERRRNLLARLLALQLAATTAVSLLAVAYVLLTGTSRDTAIIALLLSIYQVAFGFGQTLFVPACAREAMRLPAVTEAGCRAGAIVVALAAIAIGGYPLPLALVPFPVAGLLMVLVGIVSARRHGAAPSVRVSLPALRRTFAEAWPFAAADVVVLLYARADLILLGLLAGEAAAGIYFSGFKFVEVGVMPAVFLATATYPVLSSRFEGDRAAYRRASGDLLRHALLLGGLLAWGLLFVVPELVVPLLGARFAATPAIVRIMAALAIMASLEPAFGRILLAAHRQVACLRIQFFGVVVNVVLNAALIPLMGVQGAVLASIISLALMCGRYVWAARDLLPESSLLGIAAPWTAILIAAGLTGATVQHLAGVWWAGAGGALVVLLSGALLVAWRESALRASTRLASPG